MFKGARIQNWKDNHWKMDTIAGCATLSYSRDHQDSFMPVKLLKANRDKALEHGVVHLKSKPLLYLVVRQFLCMSNR